MRPSFQSLSGYAATPMALRWPGAEVSDQS